MSGQPPPFNRKKSLLIGINYTGSQHALRGCQQDVQNIAEFISYKGYSSNQRDQVIMTDAKQGPYYPNGHNILAAMDWLVSEPGCRCFLHYSGHGGQVKDPDGDRDSGFDDSIVPVDFERTGQISSDTLHKHLISRLHPASTLFVIMDCCHSGSVLELPFVYRSDGDGNVNMMDNLKKGAQLAMTAEHLLQGGFRLDRETVGEAQQLFAGAKSFFKGFQHMGEQQDEKPGLQADDFEEDWANEHKWATLFSGCKDEQTSADATIGGRNVGAMSYSFLEVMKSERNPSYLGTLQMTRQVLDQSHYQQIPQLSVGLQFNLEAPLLL